MGKVSVYKIDKKEKEKVVDELFEVISELRSKKEVFNFLVGLLTDSETLMIGRRIQIAKMLLDGKSYNQIARKLKVSHMTTGKVERWINESNQRELVARKLGKNFEKVYNVTRFTGSLLDKYHRRRK